MNGAHLHLIINHAPVFGAIGATGLLVAGMVRRSQELTRAAMWLLLIVIAAGAATYLTGEGAEDVVKRLPDVDEALIERHEEMGTVTVIAAALVGVLTVVALVKSRGREISRALQTTVLVGALAACGLLAFTSMLGGRIRHPETRPGFVQL